MKKIVLLTALLVSLKAFALQTQTSLTVEGMSCVSCASSIEKRLKEFPEVASVDIAMKTGKVIVSYQAGKHLTRGAIQKAIEDTGYKVKPEEKHAN